MSRKHRTGLALIALASVLICLHLVPAQQNAAGNVKKFTIEQILAPAYPYELVSAAKTDRIAWLAFERGMRNVYTAVGPDFEPVRLTSFMQDDGNDLTGLRISADGSVCLFDRGHPGLSTGKGAMANPTSDPKGAERATWAVKTSGGEAWKVSKIGGLLLSGDGRWAAYAKDGQIYGLSVLAPAATGEPKPYFVARGTNSNPRWAPDGARLAFVSARGDHSFIGLYDHEKQTLIYVSPGVDHDTSPTWSPDGKQIAFIRRAGGAFGQTEPAKGKGKGKANNAIFEDLDSVQKTVDKNEQKKAGGDAPKGLASGTFGDGSTVSYWVADVAANKGREFWRDTPASKAFLGVNAIQWAGDSVMFSMGNEEAMRHYAVPMNGKGNAPPIMLTSGAIFSESKALSGDGKTLFYSTNVDDIDRRHIWRVSTSGGKPMMVTSGTNIETYPAAIANGDNIAVLFASHNRPQSVAVVSAKGGDKPRVIFPTLAPEFPLDEQVVPQNVKLKAPDGLEFHNQLFMPRDIKPGEKRPAMIFVHGGPQRQMLLGYHYRHFYHMAFAFNQYLANQGYIVLSVNFRGGIGYGTSFRNAPKRGAQGNSEYQDVLAAGIYLRDHPNVDNKRVGIWGLSYGGLLTAQALSRNSDLFAAGVDLAGVHLWGNSIDPKSVSFQSSPVANVDKWKSPVLLIHGDDDRNVAFKQTVGLVQMLRANHVPHELIIFPDDVHDSLLHHRWILSFNATDDFFKRHMPKK